MLLRDVEGKSYKEIAAVLNLTEEQVKVNLFRARQKVKQTFIDIVVYGQSKYLSDMNWESATTGWRSVVKDMAVGSTNKIKLNVDGTVKTFDKGIGAATNAKIVYNLDGNYNYFTTYV